MTKNKRKNPSGKDDTEKVAIEPELAENCAVEPELADTEAMDMDQPTAVQTESPDVDQAENEALTALKADLDAATAKADEYLTLAQRVQADFDNFRRRNQNVRHDAFEDGARTFATTLLPVIDNLERALSAAKDSPDASLKEGVDMVLRQMNDVFDKRGIKPINRMGEPFDPALENAVMQGTSEDGEPGTVCEVFQKGYQMDGQVLRHAMVKVVPQ